jgi:drug/metabolite transporter (DMT)-like permease
MVLPVDFPPGLFLLGVAAAFLGLLCFLYQGLRRDHTTGQCHFTWGLSIVGLFLMGFALGLVGFDLYLTVERRYSPYWPSVFVLVALSLVAVLGFGIDTVRPGLQIGITG